MMSTFATLLVLPSIFAVVIGHKVFQSPSIYPDDRDSTHYDPLVYAEARPRRPRGHSRGGPPSPHRPHGDGNGHTPDGGRHPVPLRRRTLSPLPGGP